jgi:tetratricopeptide (TPR) repeat protein
MQRHEFREGDIFYVHYDHQYHVYKLLEKDEAGETFHVLCYFALENEPALSDIHQLEISAYHTPVHKESFTDAVFLINTPVTDDELIGYHQYQRSGENDFEESIQKATHHYHVAYNLTNEGKFEEAIQEYTTAINLAPAFYEAIDNRAFCKMDLGRWRDAIEDFQLSLQVNPDSLAAEFSIGECYYRLGEFAKAKEQFGKCLQIDPAHVISREFLVKSQELMDKMK